MARVMSRMKSEPPQAGARPFKALAYVSRAYEDAKGDWWLEGIASGPALDSYGDRMSPECVDDMAAQINSGQIRLLQGHYNDWEGVIGWLKSGEVNLQGLLVVQCWLDKEDAAVQKLWRQLQGDERRGIAPAKLGLSIGGWLIDGRGEVLDGDYVFTITKLQLDHTAVTSRPANPDAWITGLEVKHKEFARQWVRDIAKAAKDSMRGAVLRNGGDPVDEDEDKTDPGDPNGAESTGDAVGDSGSTPPAEEAKEAPSAGGEEAVGKTDAPDMEQLLKAAFDDALAAMSEIVKEQMASVGAIKYIRAIDLIGDELVAVKDETAEAAATEDGADEGEEPESEGEDAAEGGDESDDAEQPAKSGRNGDMEKDEDLQDKIELAQIKARRLAKENAELRAKLGMAPAGGERRGLHSAEGDEAVTKARQGDPPAKEKAGTWVDQLKATKEYKEASRSDKIEMLKAGLPAQIEKHFAGAR